MDGICLMDGRCVMDGMVSSEQKVLSGLKVPTVLKIYKIAMTTLTKQIGKMYLPCAKYPQGTERN